MKNKIKLILFANMFAIFFTMLIYIDDIHSKMWMALEIIILPLIYSLGYEILMYKQKKEINHIEEELQSNISALKNRTMKLEKENQDLKKIIKSKTYK